MNFYWKHTTWAINREKKENNNLDTWILCINKTNWYIIQEEFGDYNDIYQCKVRDHCLYPDKYRSAADNTCDLK